VKKFVMTLRHLSSTIIGAHRPLRALKDKGLPAETQELQVVALDGKNDTLEGNPVTKPRSPEFSARRQSAPNGREWS
jgi:hypothetical protein